MRTLRQSVTVAFGLSSAAILGFVRAGLSGTTAGEALSLQTQQLSREIAQLFLPAIQSAIRAVTGLVNWFKDLTGEEQRAIGAVTGISVAMLGLAAIGPRIVGMVQAVNNVFAALSANPILLIVGGLAALLASTEEGRDALGELFEAFRPIIDAVLAVFAPLAEILGEIAGVIARVLGPAFRVLGAIIKAVLFPITLVINALKAIFKGHTIEFNTQHGSRQLHELRGEERRREIEARRADIAEEEALADMEGGAIGGRRRYFNRPRQAELEEQITEAERRDRARGGRNELAPAKTAFEQVAETWKRIQQAALKTDYARQTAQAVATQVQLQQAMVGFMAGFMGQPVPPAQPPAVA